MSMVSVGSSMLAENDYGHWSQGKCLELLKMTQIISWWK